MWPNPQFPADFVTFTEEILNSILFFVQFIQKIWFIKQTKINDCIFQHFGKIYGKIWVSFCRNTGKRFYLEVRFKSNIKSIGFSKMW